MSVRSVLKRVVFNYKTILIVLSLGLFLIIYNWIGNTAVELLVDETLQRKLTISKAGANNIGTFVNLYINSFKQLANGQSTENLKLFREIWKDSPIGSVAFVNADGIIENIQNDSNETLVGTSVKEKEYFKKTIEKQSGDLFIGEPSVAKLGPNEGKVFLPIGIVRQNNGIIVSSFIISDMGENYISNLKTSQNTQVFVVRQDGIVINSTNLNLIGMNIINFIDKNNYLGGKQLKTDIENKIFKQDFGTFDYAWPQNWEQDSPIKRYLGAYSSVIVNDQKWYVVVATPIEDALNKALPIYTGQRLMLVLAFIVITIYLISVTNYYSRINTIQTEHKRHGLNQSYESEE